MILARIFTNIYKEGGIILIDAKGQKYICGNPKKEKPITLKLLKENLNWKLIIDPEIEFPEAYMRGEIKIENGTLLVLINFSWCSQAIPRDSYFCSVSIFLH